MSDDPKQAESLIVRFFAKLTENVGAYGFRVLMTMQINQIEARHQKPNQARIFRKRMDELGIVESCEFNPAYHGFVEPPARPEAKALTDFLERLEGDDDFLVRFDRMLALGELEQQLEEKYGQEDLPKLLKKVDDCGVVIDAKINPALIRQV